jgi:hypothetical protein
LILIFSAFSAIPKEIVVILVNYAIIFDCIPRALGLAVGLLRPRVIFLIRGADVGHFEVGVAPDAWEVVQL